MIDVLIVEDERPSARKLQAMLTTTAPDLKVIDILDSITDTVDFLSKQQVELIFLDIHLADGNCFEIFKKIEVKTPIIFTTAYDQYAIQAFEQNSIGYLLKPIDIGKLKSSIEKFRTQTHAGHSAIIDYQQLSKAIANHQIGAVYRERFLIHYRGKMKSINIEDIAYFYAESRGVFIRLHNGAVFDINLTLEQLTEEVNPRQFFRVNRKFLVNIVAIEEAYSYSKSKLKLMLKPATETEVIISSEKASKFKQWLAK